MTILPALVCGLLLIVSTGGSSVADQAATPETGSDADERLIISELVERLESVGFVDQGPEGRSAGDLIVWGPNPLFDAENVIDTGATVQGICLTFNAESDCVLTETIDFGSGGTLEIRGIRPGAATSSIWIIVGGSGSFLGASGTVTVRPTIDPAIWARRFEIWL